MVFYKILIVCFFYTTFFQFNTFAQKNRVIAGNVKDSSTKEALSDVILVFSIEGKTTSYAVSDSLGNYSLQFLVSDSTAKPIINLSAKLIGYATKQVNFKLVEQLTILPTIFLPNQAVSLSEVIIQAKPIEKKGDTTVFNVGSFKNKFDENLEDVIKKIPGMDVDANGNIKYNNKPIENIMIEGDVMSNNYKLISKNITPDMVDKVEMIDKYNSNPVLKDLSNSQKQTMNLVLKNPKKLKHFGTVKLGAGVENKFNATGTAFVFNDAIKNMSVVNANNIGKSPYSEYSFGEDFANGSDYDFAPTLLPNYITENKLFTQSFFGNNVNSLFNKSGLGVFNNIFRLNKKTSLKIFSNLYGDKINQYQQTVVQNNLYPQLSYHENLTKTFTPLNFNNTIELKQTTKNAQLLINGSFIQNKYNENADVKSLISSNSTLNSLYNRAAGAAYYTQKIDSLKAFEISYQYTFDKKKQAFSANQNNYRLLDSVFITNFQNQQTNNVVKVNTSEIKYFFKNKRTNQISIKNVYSNTDYYGSLNIKDNAGINFTLPNYVDTTTIKDNRLTLNYNTGFAFKNFFITTDISLLLNNYTIKNGYATRQNSKKLYLIPRFNINYSINSVSRINGLVSWEIDPPNLVNSPLHPILIGYRTIKNNNSFLLPTKKLNYSLTYTYTNIDKATSLIFSYYHNILHQSEISNYKFTTDFDYVTTRYELTSQKLDNIFLKFDKYFYPIKTSFGLKQSLTWFNNPSEVLNVITSNKFIAYNANLSLRPTFGSKFNLNMGIDYKYNKDRSAANNTYQLNPFIDFSSSLTKKISFGSRFNYFNSNYNPQKRNYVFANMYAWYIIKPQKISAKFSFFNVFNTNASLSGYATTAISKSVVSNLLTRYALLEFDFKF
ncbi:MAG: hypothetical protein ABI685_12125 [Ferruginibacter sp.]